MPRNPVSKREAARRRTSIRRLVALHEGSVAKAATALGASVASVSKWNRGLIVPNLTAVKLADILTNGRC